MSDRLAGLRLTKTERLLCVALSYIYTAPLVWRIGKELVSYFNATIQEAQRQLRPEDGNPHAQGE